MALLLRQRLLLLVSLLLSACDFSRASLSCYEHIPAGDTGRYIIKDNGIVLDPDTGIEWYRCAFGQRYVPQGCSGDALLVTHDEVDSMLAEISAKAGQKWRLPTEGEFQSLREPNCVNPAINTNVFPNPLITNFWVLGEGIRDNKACVVYAYNARRSCRVPRTEPRPFYMVKAT
jgi:hypothetical protein